MTWYFALLAVIAAFLFMEFMAWFTHKYVMHGFLWVLHKDHHIRDGRKFEYNDLFAVMFAVPSFFLMFYGLKGTVDIKFYLGLGIALYGISYFLFHDVYVHQRVKLKRVENRYLRATLRAHMEHHTQRSRRNYGFLLAPFKYYKEEFSHKKANNSLSDQPNN